MNAHCILAEKNSRPLHVPKRIKQAFTTALCLAALMAFKVSSLDLDSLQQEFLAMKYGMFLHFNMATFTHQEWADPNQDPNLFQPDSLDCGQWADAAAAAGMKYMVLTAKHHDGFCLWPTAYTTYNVSSSSWRSGQGDVIKEFTDSCRSRGLAAGLYFSIWDMTHANDEDIDFIKNQLTELLTNYGPIAVLWFDGWGWNIPYESIPYQTIQTLIKSIQPACLIINNNHEANLVNSDIVEWEAGGNEDMVPEGNTLPSEVCETIMNEGNWFNPGTVTSNDLHTATFLKNQLIACNSRNANLLLDVTPDVHGRIPACQVELLIESRPEGTGAIHARARPARIQAKDNAAGKIFDLTGRLLNNSPARKNRQNPAAVCVYQLTNSGGKALRLKSFADTCDK